MKSQAHKEICTLVDDGGRPASGGAPADSLDQLGERVRTLLRDDPIEVSKVRPFFWSLVETYVDRFQTYPFDVSRALLNYLELRDYPREEIQQLIPQLQTLLLKQHGECAINPLTNVAADVSLDDELRELRDCLKYAAMVGERQQQD